MKETQAYQNQLQKEIKQVWEYHEKPVPTEVRKEKNEGNQGEYHNPDSGYYVKDGQTKQFAYYFHAASDRNEFFLGTIVTPGIAKYLF